MNKTQRGQELWVKMEASTRTIFFHDIATGNKSNTPEDRALINFIKGQKADAMTMSKTEYENARNGKSTKLNVRGTFDKKTGFYDKTSDWDETHVVILNDGIDAHSMTDVIIFANKKHMDLDQDELNESAELQVASHESIHTLQDNFDVFIADYDDKTQTYSETNNEKDYNDRSNENAAISGSDSILAQLFEKYRKAHPDLFNPKKEKPRNQNGN